MNRMKEQAGLSIQAKWRLAATYALTGKMKPAEELVYNAETTVDVYKRQVPGETDGLHGKGTASAYNTFIL